ncbi:MAG: hypothetical protein MJ168_05485 [Clostridia bacterium]|nr:hypothetical protein [Clostridia bacterium]
MTNEEKYFYYRESVLISIRPNWCELIASGKKTIEVRKTKPKIQTPFKCYIYSTQSDLLTKSHNTGQIYVATSKKYQGTLEKRGNTTLSGKVIGEFICDYIATFDDDVIHSFSNEEYSKWNDCNADAACIHPEDLEIYANDSWLYGWHISELVIYDAPKELSDFGLSRPPQSWCYVEEVV